MSPAGLDETEAWYFMRLAAQRRGQVLNWTWILVAIAVALVIAATSLDHSPLPKPTAPLAHSSLKRALRDRAAMRAGRP